MLARDVPLDILESNEFKLARASSEDTLHSRQLLTLAKQQHQILHPLDKSKVHDETTLLRDELQNFLLKTVSYGDDVLQQKINSITVKKRFTYALRFYRDNIKNPETLQKKIYNLILDPNSEYKRVKEQQKVQAEREREVIKSASLPRRLITQAEKSGEKSLEKSKTSVEYKPQIMSLAKSKSEQFLKILTQRKNLKRQATLKNFTMLKKSSILFKNQSEFSIDQQGPDNNIFLKEKYLQNQHNQFKRNNYAVDLIKPNHNLPQYQRRAQDKLRKTVTAKSFADLSYLFNNQKSIVITESSPTKLPLVRELTTQSSQTFITSNSQYNHEPITPPSFKVQQYRQSHTVPLSELPSPEKQTQQQQLAGLSIKLGEANYYEDKSRVSSITSMDTDKMHRLNMEADEEHEDTQLHLKKRQSQAIGRQPRRIRTINSNKKEKEESKFKFKVLPCYPKQDIDAYMQKFDVVNISPDKWSPSKMKQKQKLATDKYKEKIAFFLSESKKELAEVKQSSKKILKRREFLQTKIEGGLMNASQNIYTEYNKDVFPSNEQMKMINKELKKINSINNERVMFNIKPNRKIEEFKPLRKLSKLEIDQNQYREQFLSHLEKENSGSDDESNFEQFTIRGLREFPSFYKIKQQLKLLYDQPNLQQNPIIIQKQDESQVVENPESVDDATSKSRKRKRRTIIEE